MKSAIVILALCGYACAVPLVAPAVVGLTSGTSSQFRSQDNLGNYAFGYNEDHATGGTFRREQGQPGVMVGSYGLRDADGRSRVVNYVADAAGFRANIQTNEPGVEPKDPAAVLINKAQAIVAPALAAPVVAPAALTTAHVAAPLAVAHAAPYAVAHAAPLAHSSYSTVTQHVSPAVSHYVAPAATVLSAPAIAAPVVSHYASPLATYATKTVHAAAPLVNYW